MANRQRQIVLDRGHSGCCRLHEMCPGARGPQLTWGRKMTDKGIEDCPDSVEDTRGMVVEG